MTIAEIESTLQTLLTRHPNLDEGMLVTLLTASSWEGKNIQDAVVLFKNKYQQNVMVSQKPTPKVEINSSSQKNAIAQKTIENNGFSAIPIVPQVTPVTPSSIVQPLIPQNSVPIIKQTTVASSVENKVGTTQKNIGTEGVPESIDLVYYDTEGKEEEILPVYYDDGKELPKVTEPLIITQPEKINPVAQITTPPEVIPVIEEKEFPKVVEQKIIEQKKEDTQISKVAIIEPQSLIEQKIEARSPVQPIELPENLPLKPFESAPHVWPFSKYKEVFHGSGVPILSSKEEDLVKKEKESQVYVKNVEEKQVIKKVKVKRTGFDGEDEGLIFLTGITLLIILLLLAYMYSNGRF